MLYNFGSNWIQKILLTAKIGLGLRPRPILAVLRIFLIQLFPNWTHVGLLHTRIYQNRKEFVNFGYNRK